MNGALTATVLALLWGMTLLRLPTLWRDARQRAFWAVLATLALTKTVATPGVNEQLSALISEARIVPHLLGVTTAYFLLRFISLVTDYDRGQPRARRHQTSLAASVLVSLLLLAAVPGDLETRAADLTTTDLSTTDVAYWVILNGYLGVVLTIATALFWRIGRSASARLLRNGLRAIAAGTFLVALYAVLKTSAIVVHSLGTAVSFTTIEPAANALRTVGTIIAVVGAAVPASGKLRSVIHAYRSLWALRPLWRLIRKSFPDVVLFPRSRALLELAGVDDVRLRLYRRVIEIRDGMLTLRGYLPAGTLAEARKQVGDRPELIEACGIALALERHRSGWPPTEATDRWTDIGSEITDEVAWLSAVSAAFRDSQPAAFVHNRPKAVDPTRART